MSEIARFVDVLIRLFALGLFVRMILGWLQPSGLRSAILYLDRVYEPVLRPLRQIVKPVKLNVNPPTTLDLSSIVLLLGLWWFIHPFAMWILARPR